jgi:hypothetical protein
MIHLAIPKYSRGPETLMGLKFHSNAWGLLDSIVASICKGDFSRRDPRPKAAPYDDQLSDRPVR